MPHTSRLEQIKAFALATGWTATHSAHGSTCLHAPPPHDTVKIVIPAGGQLRDSVARSWVRKIGRYADPVKLAVAVHGFEDQELIQAIGARIAPAAPVSEPAPKPAPPPKPGPRPAPEPHVVSERPWLAHNGIGSTGVGMSYESKVVVERHWSDGSVDYRCAVPGCGFARPKPRSVARHYGSTRSADHPEVGDYRRGQLLADPGYTEPAFHREVPPPVDRLRREIQKALAVIWDDVTTGEYARDDLATRLAELMIEARPEHEPCEPRGPLDPEEILTRIRLLVGDHARTQELERQHAEAAERLAKVEHELAAARSDADDMRSRWSALRQLMDD